MIEPSLLIGCHQLGLAQGEGNVREFCKKSGKISVLVKVRELCFHFAARFCEDHNPYSIECVQMLGFWSVVFVGNTFHTRKRNGKKFGNQCFLWSCSKVH